MNPYDNNAPPDELEPDERHPVTILSNIYLEIGLPLQAAVQSAIADYQSIFDDAALCLT